MSDNLNALKEAMNKASNNAIKATQAERGVNINNENATQMLLAARKAKNNAIKAWKNAKSRYNTAVAKKVTGGRRKTMKKRHSRRRTNRRSH